MGYVGFSPTYGPPEKVGVMWPILILSPFYWGPREHGGLRSNADPFFGPSEGRGDVANSDFDPFLLGTPKNAWVT